MHNLHTSYRALKFLKIYTCPLLHKIGEYIKSIQNSENNNCERHEVNDQFWKLSIAVLQPSSANEMNIKNTRLNTENMKYEMGNDVLM